MRLPWQAHQTHRRLCPGLRSAMDEFAVRAALQSLPERVAHCAHTSPPCRKTHRSQPPEDRACLAVVEPVWGVRAQDFQHVVAATVAAPAQCKVSVCLPWGWAGQSGSSLDPLGLSAPLLPSVSGATLSSPCPFPPHSSFLGLWESPGLRLGDAVCFLPDSLSLAIMDVDMHRETYPHTHI